MLVATLRVAEAMGLPMESMEGLINVNGRELLLTSKGLIIEERRNQDAFPCEQDRRKSGEGRTC